MRWRGCASTIEHERPSCRLALSKAKPNTGPSQRVNLRRHRGFERRASFVSPTYAGRATSAAAATPLRTADSSVAG
jgi:hypothetical protein